LLIPLLGGVRGRFSYVVQVFTQMIEDYFKTIKPLFLKRWDYPKS
jgi:hypothetical protein